MRAAIDLGSQSLLLCIEREGELIWDESRSVRLGAGLGERGRFAPDRMALAREVLRDFCARVRAEGLPPEQIVAGATSAARRALNAREFFDSIEEELGLRVSILSGEEEARLSWLGAQRGAGLTPGTALILVDLGGGSMELAWGEAGERAPEGRCSLGLGVVKAWEALGSEPWTEAGRAALRQLTSDQLSGVRLPQDPGMVLGVAGTTTTLAALEAGLERFEAGRIQGMSLSRARLMSWGDELAVLGPAARRLRCAVDPSRADLLPGGAWILGAALEHLGVDALRVSVGGLRYGLLREASPC